MFDNPFGIEGEQYWNSPWTHCAELIENYMFDGQLGTFIDAPPEVDLNTHTSVPMLVFHALPEKDLAELVFDQMAQVVVSDVHRRTVVVADAVEPSDPPRSPRPFDPTRTESTSFVTITDLADHGGITEVGEYVATVLLRDQSSNRVRIAVRQPPVGYQDPAVLQFLAEQRERAPRAWPAPVRPPEGTPLPTYRETPSSLAAPDQPGFSATVERVIVAARDARCVLSASFRLPAFAHDQIPPSRAGDRGLDYGSPRPTAIIPLSVVVVGTTDISAKVLNLRVPSWDPLARDDEDPMVTGTFEVDLFDGVIWPGVAQTNFIYLFSGEYMAGPFPAAVVLPSQVPGHRG